MVRGLTKSLVKKVVVPSINKVTGKSEYELGDLSKMLAQDYAELLGGEKKDRYELGDLTRAWVGNFTGKTEYMVGNVSEEIVRRVQSGEYSTEDMWLLCGLLVSLGVGLTPVAHVLPIKLLLQLLNFAISRELNKRTRKVLVAIATTLDERFKEALTGDPNTQAGEMTKQAVLDYLQKENYEAGDILRSLNDVLMAAEDSEGEKKGGNISLRKGIVLCDKVLDELDKWDDVLLKRILE